MAESDAPPAPAEPAEPAEPSAGDADVAPAAAPELPAEAVAQAAGDSAAAEGGEASPASPTETEADDSPAEKVVRRGPPITRQASKEIIEGIRRKRSSSICESIPGDDTQEKLDAEEAKWRIPAGFFYDPSSPDLCPTLEERELPRSATKASRFMGYDFSRVNNAVWTSNEEFAYITGHVVCFMNIQTRQRRFLHGRDNGGIGAIAMSPDLIYFAAAERSITAQPNVYIYSFKTMRLYRILRKGTSRGYASVAFSPHNKNHLAALGCAPDYLLSVWDWRNERLLLKCKAYGQEIYSIRWGQFPGILTSVGVGHIRFWKMATTFTGLKLQGDLGKFGASELSDISGFVELPDGKVVTGSEYGKLLLWEGVFVKVELMRAKDNVTQADAGTSIAGCPHAGSIDMILMDRENGMVISGGDDGHLRWWPIEEIDTAEADYDNGILEFGIRMRKEIRIPPSSGEHNVHPAHIQHVVVGEDEVTWLIQDSRNGMIWIFDMLSGTCTSALSCHSQQVTGTVVSSSYAGLVMSCGMDGTVRAFNVSQPWDNELYRDLRPLENTVGATCMDATPELVDPSKRTVCAGYTDGTIRAFTACSDGFLQLQALKPHNCMVKQLKYSPDEFGLMATLGEDNSIFFFQVQLLSEHAIPIGFVKIPVAVNYFSWDDMSGKVLLSLGDGSLLALSSPNLDTVNNSETYEIEVNYTAVMPDVPEIEESDEEEEEEEEEEGEAKEGEEGEASPTATEAPTEAEGEEEEGKKKKRKKKEEKPKDDDDDEEKHVEVVVTSVSRAIFIPGDSDDSERKVVFTGTGKYSGGLWEGSMVGVEETRISEVPLAECMPQTVSCLLRSKIPQNVQVTHLSLSPALNWIILGFADGRVWLVPRVHGGTFASVHVSDGMSGAVNAVSMLEDESMMLVAAGDGSLVTFLVSDGLLELSEIKAQGKEVNMADAALELENAIPEMPDMSMEGWSLPPKETPGVLAINPDITDAAQYSIQDAKLKAEEDSAKAAAELKKLRVRERISEIRNELADLQAKNQHLYEAQLSNTDMVVDQEYINHLKEDMENQIEQVRFELAWLVEFHERGLQKLKDYYLKQVDFERIEVLGFQSDHRVSTFRCAKMSSELQANLARLHELIFAAGEGDGDEEDDDGDDGLGFDGKSTLRGHRTDFAFDGTDNAGSQNTEKPLSGAEQRELRRQQRMLRKAQMQELERAKPSESYEAPEDVEAIANAEATLGNYMLKTSQDYQVPENQRMNAEKKRRQMFLLEESIHAIKTEFNQRVMALRDFRQQVRAEVQRDLQALAEIDEQLGTSTGWVVGILENPPGAPPEFPETRFHLEDADIKAFASKLRGDPEEAPAAEDQFDEEDEEEGDEEVDGEVELEEGEEEAGDEQHEETGRKSSLKKGKGPSQASVPLSGRAALAARRVGRLTLRGKLLQEKSGGDELSQAVNVESQARLRHDKGQLEEHVRQVVDTFNMAVASIEKEKAKLESDLKNAEMKLLVLYEELLTLNELEEKDETLLKKATKCRQDKTSVMHQIKECQDQLSEKKAEIEEWHTQEQNLQAEFTDLVGENSPFLSALLKVYKKKVKRSKRKKGGEEEDFDEDEEDEDDEGSDIESDEDEDMEDDDTGPPQGCDHQIYESVIDLRDKRLEMEDALQEIQKAVEGLKQTHKKLLDDERRIDKEQKMTDAEIQQFQTDKQRKLNQVPIVFALRLSQVQCLAPESDSMERMPAELGQQVIFTNEGLKRLMSRITELHQEIKEVKARHKQLQRDFRVRKKDKNVALQHIEDLHGKFQDIQMLKFGQIVDLDLIERSAPNKYVQELQEKVLQAEAEHRRRIAEWQKRMEKQKKELTKITCDNTSLMEQIVSMGYSQMQLDAALNARIANVTVNDNEPLNELREMERDRCKDLLSLQSKEIATLKAEINLFRKKGGHIYTTVTANRQ